VVSITHIALGGYMGEAFSGIQIGKMAMIWGVMAQSIPHIDSITACKIICVDKLIF
jgi:hypothetical protein